MRNRKKSFGNLLEQYMFEAAVQFIDLADSDTQRLIINLINDIDTTPPSHTIATDSSSLSVGLDTTSSAKFHSTPLDEQGQKAVPRLVGRKRNRSNAYRPSQYLILAYQVAINTTTASMNQLQSLIYRAENSLYSSLTKAQLINHYQAVIARYATYLDKVRVLQIRELNKLQSLLTIASLLAVVQLFPKRFVHRNQ